VTRKHPGLSGWIPFVQDISPSQPAACRKGKQLYIAQRQISPVSEQADKLGRQICGERRSRPQPRDCFLSLEAEDKPEQPPVVEKEVYSFGGGRFFFLYTVISHILWFRAIPGEFFRAWSLWLPLCSSRQWLDVVTWRW